MAQIATVLVDRHLRLAPCPRCDGRHRGLAESEGRIVGHCLHCGEALDAPLQVQPLVAAVATGAPGLALP
jgi:hypothetical protein